MPCKNCTLLRTKLRKIMLFLLRNNIARVRIIKHSNSKKDVKEEIYIDDKKEEIILNT